jgi:hypothetical protein
MMMFASTSRFLPLSIIAVLVPVTFAQRDTATLSGTVRDASGAVIPGAKITATSLATAISTTTTSNAEGEYVITPLHVGDYNLSAQAAGFAPRAIERIHLDVDQRLRVDIPLTVGASEQRVTVTEVPPPLNTEDMTVGQVIGTRQIADMPLNGRNFQQLAALVPGAIPSYGGRDSAQGGVSLSGTRSWDNAFLLDGVNNSTYTAEMPTRVNLAVSPNLDAIQEFKIQSSSYDAQYGSAIAGVINIVTKSGTNELHGTAYDYLRNSALNANTWQNNRSGLAKGVRIRNQFGAVLGGPVVLPGVYNGRDHTFFFVDYEGVREILPPGFTNVVVPDAKMRSGDFSEFLPGNTNPFGKNFILNAPYVNNMLPASQLDKVAGGLVALYPNSNVPGTLNYQTNTRNTFDSDLLGVRMDHRFSEHDSIFGRYSQSYATSGSTTWSDLLGPTTQNKTDGNNVVLSETHIFRPNLINEIRVGYSRARPYRLPTAPNRDLYQELGLTGVPYLPNMPTGFLRFNGFPGIQAIGRRSGYYNDLGIVHGYTDNLTYVVGRHNLRMGAELRPTRTAHFESQAPRGDFQFFDSNAVDSDGNPLVVGFAQFLTGMPSRVSFSTANDIIYRSGIPLNTSRMFSA